jgi:hypothetical protein
MSMSVSIPFCRPAIKQALAAHACPHAQAHHGTSTSHNSMQHLVYQTHATFVDKQAHTAASGRRTARQLPFTAACQDRRAITSAGSAAPRLSQNTPAHHASLPGQSPR